MADVEIRFQVPTSVSSALRQAPETYGREMRLAAAAKWYELGLLSQEQAARVAEVART